jgi:hypothetical protein
MRLMRLRGAAAGVRVKRGRPDQHPPVAYGPFPRG